MKSALDNPGKDPLDDPDFHGKVTLDVVEKYYNRLGQSRRWVVRDVQKMYTMVAELCCERIDNGVDLWCAVNSLSEHDQMELVKTVQAAILYINEPSEKILRLNALKWKL